MPLSLNDVGKTVDSGIPYQVGRSGPVFVVMGIKSPNGSMFVFAESDRPGVGLVYTEAATLEAIRSFMGRSKC